MTTSKRLKKKVRTMMTERGVSYTTALRMLTQDAEAKLEHEATAKPEETDTTQQEKEG